ncbi:DUF6048 family protein [Flavobacterium crassostreae]|uniref:Outer membrane protein beta-barrel domain-containing protein n=1 Tax=Flavobacterium crassostreae TaxID=1763534 RepID=A0A1B9E0L2_9FLAO|nr:DUF6048 family protein [Flavobacterium crassostreae]OCB75485.1 hypothetical protein LPBF_07720 [Flavobacterium crassostreae]
MKHILKYFFSICLVFLVLVSSAQKTNTPNGSAVLPTTLSKSTNKDAKTITDTNTVAKTTRYGLRLGVDLFKISRSLYDKNYKGIEFTGDYRVTKKYFIAAELGNENKTTTDDRVHFATKGSYLKVGFDYNGYQNWLDMENSIYVGLRYGFSSFNQQLYSYKIYNATPYFAEVQNSVSGQNYDGLTASWAEVVAGIKAKVFNNVFVGFSLRLNSLISNKKPANFDNLYIPGFNRTYNGSFGVGFNYSVSYLIPIYKKNVRSPK